MNSISFANAYLLFIALPIAALLAVPFALAVRKDNVNGHNVASLVIHIIMALLIAFAAAGTRFVTVMTETDLYVVADVSYSADKNLDTVDSYILNVRRALPLNTRMGVICFGKDYKLHARLGEGIRSVKQADVDDSETDVINALEYAGSLFRDGVLKRIVLITDGKDTNSADANALRREINNLNAQNIKVDAIYLDDNISDSAKEVQVTSVEYTQTTFKNREEKATAVIQSSFSSESIVRLYKDGEEYGIKAPRLDAGTNYINFDLDTSESGSYDYEVRVTVSGDESSYNNSCYFSQTVSGSVKVLFITQKYEDVSVAEQLFGEDAEVEYNINNPSAMPLSVEALCAYDEIYISNADIDDLFGVNTSNRDTFLGSLNTVVSQFGKSLITLGDTGIPNKSEGQLDALDKMLPVRYGNSSAGKLYTIVLDSSRSMELNSRFITAKRAVLNLINNVLSPQDSVCVVTFYGGVHVVQPIATVESCREELINNIQNLSVTQGTNIELGLDSAVSIIGGADYAEKEVMLMTDGLSYNLENSGENILDKARELRAYGVTLSVLDVGRGARDDDAAKSAESLLKNITTVDGGSENNYHLAMSPEEADSVVLGEIAPITKETVVNRYSFVDINRHLDDSLKGIDSASYVAGYYNSAKVPGVTNVLTTGYQTPTGTEIEVPIYAYRTLGNGKVAAFTSDISGNWLSAWERTGLKRQFFNNVFTSLIPSEKIDYPFTFEFGVETGSASVTVTPSSRRADATAVIRVTSPGDKTLTGNLVPNTVDGVFMYGYNFAATELGKYDIEVTYTYGGNSFTAHKSFNISYLPEYDSFTAYDASVLHKAIGLNGVVSEDGNITIENNPDEVSSRIVTLTVPLLAICVSLFAVDIIIRKLKWADIKSLFVKVK